MKSPVYNTQGKQAGEVDAPEHVFGVAWNGDLVHQVASVMRQNRRTPTTHAKDRSERRGGGAKPWRQKGTGRSRHGSRRSPIWRKGGVTHGPRNEKNTSRNAPQKMKRKALYSVLSRKFANGQVIFLDQLDLSEPKTARAKEVLMNLEALESVDQLGSRAQNAAYIAVPEKHDEIVRSFSNLGNVVLDEVRNMNVLDVAQYRYVVIVDPENAFEHFYGATATPAAS